MDEQMNLTKVLDQTLQFLGYSEKLKKQTFSDLEEIISIRYYKKIQALLITSNINIENINDINSINALAKKNIDQDTLNNMLLEITKETINEYFEEISKE